MNRAQAETEKKKAEKGIGEDSAKERIFNKLRKFHKETESQNVSPKQEIMLSIINIKKENG